MVFTRQNRVSARKKGIKRKRSAGAQSKQILSNLRSIESLKQANRADAQLTTLQHQVTNNVLTDYKVHCIVPSFLSTPDCPAWSPAFWSQSVISNSAPQATCGRIYIDMAFTINSERQPLNFTVMHVKLKPDMADYIVKTQGMGLSVLTGTDYTFRGVSTSTQGVASLYGCATLNPAFFKTVKRWDFSLGSTVNTSALSASTTVLGNTQKLIRYSFPTSYRMGTPGIDGQSWTTLAPDEICKNEHLNYIIVFSDNVTGLDLGYPSYSLNCICTSKALV